MDKLIVDCVKVTLLYNVVIRSDKGTLIIGFVRPNDGDNKAVFLLCGNKCRPTLNFMR